jgi:hypothetical protein
MNIIIYALFAVCILGIGGANSETDDPVADFVRQRWDKTIAGEALMMIRVDLNGDGIPEVFLSEEKDTNGRLGNIWMVYISQGSKFLRSDNLITLDPRTLVVKKSKNRDRDQLISVTSPQKGELLLMQLFVSETDVASKMIATIKLSEVEASDIVISILKCGDQSVVPVIKGSVQELTRIIHEK